MQSPGSQLADAPVLAHAADVLSEQLLVQLERFAKLLEPHAAGLEQRFLARLERSQLEPRQRKALAAITPGAAAKTLACGRPIADFLEQVEYSGRRLAKLNLQPGEVTHALGEYDALLTPILRELAPRDYANLQWCRDQLQFCVVLTLNNAYYQVREQESQAFYELLHAEVEAGNLSDFLGKFLKTLAQFCHAETAAIFLLDREAGRWVRQAGVEKGAPVATGLEAPSTRSRTRLLSRPKCFEPSKSTLQLSLDAQWPARYQAFWSVPLGGEGRLEGVMQFAFSSRYEWLPRELGLLTSAGKRCLKAIEKVRLARALADREEQIRTLARHMLQVEEIERRRISRELHDEAGQSLLCARMQLEMLEQSLPPELDEPKAQARRIRELVETTIREIRRVIAALSPAVLEQLGLAAALRQLVNRFSQVHTIRSRLEIRAGEAAQTVRNRGLSPGAGVLEQYRQTFQSHAHKPFVDLCR